MPKKSDPLSIVPDQREGVQKNIEYVTEAVDENDARRLFILARNRLVDVNHWHEFSTPARFQLTDSSGRELDRTAEKGDFFKINVGAPGPIEGSGFDWVFIESVDDHSNPEGKEEHMAMRVRPASNPMETSNDTAHFFSHAATSTFVVRRDERKISASVFGRNETANTQTSKLLDKVRNTVVALTAFAGISDIQWKSLVHGLIPIDQ
jgi:hypothetical protein